MRTIRILAIPSFLLKMRHGGIELSTTPLTTLEFAWFSKFLGQFLGQFFEPYFTSSSTLTPSVADSFLKKGKRKRVQVAPHPIYKGDFMKKPLFFWLFFCHYPNLLFNNIEIVVC